MERISYGALMIFKRLIDTFSSFKRFYLRNSNQIIVVKSVKKLMKMKMNYAISVINPDNLHIFSGLDSDIQLLRSAEVINDISLTSDIMIPQYYGDEYLMKLKNTIIDTETGIAFTQFSNPVAILESSNILAMEVSDYLRPRNPRKIHHGEWTVLSSRSYGHWLLQDVPRFLRLLEVSENLNVAISRDGPKHVQDFLNILKIEPVLVGPVFKPESYICISTQYQIGKPSLFDIFTLKKFRDEASSQYLRENEIKNVHGDKIFISRRFSKRPLPNELYLEETAIKNGFQVVYLESMSFAEEIQMFMEAKIIVGANGSGLSNIVWIDENICRKVVEIYDTNFDHQAISQLANRLNVPYYRVLYTEATEREEIWNY